MPRRPRAMLTATTVLVATILLWLASAIRPIVTSLPSPGRDDRTLARATLALIDGRAILLHRRATLVSDVPEQRLTDEFPAVPDNPNDWLPARPLACVDLTKARVVMVRDEGTVPPRFAPESYSSAGDEYDRLRHQPWGWLGFDFGWTPRYEQAFGTPPRERTFTVTGGYVRVANRFWAVPLWPPLAVAAGVLVRIGWRNRRSERWCRADRCTTCGYDLRASPDRCPECGTIPPPPKTIR